jgi:hypothetical protein
MIGAATSRSRGRLADNADVDNQGFIAQPLDLFPHVLGFLPFCI